MIQYSRRWVEPERYLGRWLDPRLASLRVADVCAYLLRHDWKTVPPDRPDTLVFQEPPGSDGEVYYQFVPASESAPDYFRRIVELVTLLSVSEDRHPVQILDEMLGPPGQANGIGETRPHDAGVAG
jgi:hypothetical protein